MILTGAINYAFNPTTHEQLSATASCIFGWAQNDLHPPKFNDTRHVCGVFIIIISEVVHAFCWVDIGLPEQALGWFPPRFRVGYGRQTY